MEMLLEAHISQDWVLLQEEGPPPKLMQVHDLLLRSNLPQT